MAKSTWLGLVAGTGVMVCLAHPAKADMIVFNCASTRTWMDGAAKEVKTRIEIATDTLAYFVYRDYDSKPRFGGRGTLVELGAARVTFFDSPGMVGYIDRTSGETYWRDQQHETEQHGTCDQIR
jgi:hypothetical protein